MSLLQYTAKSHHLQWNIKQLSPNQFPILSYLLPRFVEASSQYRFNQSFR